MAHTRHTKKRALTADELVQAKDGVVEHLQEINKLEGELAFEKKKYADKIKPHKVLVQDLMRKIATGFDEGTEYCRVVIDPVTQTVKFFVDRWKFNDETQKDERVEELFDELSFETVGEKQLSMWQEESEESAIEEAIDRIDQDEWRSFDEWVAKFYDENDGLAYAEDLVHALASPFPTPVADWYLKETGAPSSNVNIALSSQGLRAALKVLEIDLTGDGHAYNYLAEKLSGMLFSDTVNGPAILSMMIEWANTEEVDSDEKDEEQAIDEVCDGDVL